MVDILADGEGGENKFLKLQIIGAKGLPVLSHNIPLSSPSSEPVTHTSTCSPHLEESSPSSLCPDRNQLNQLPREKVLEESNVEEENDICEPYWGSIPQWRRYLCMAGISALPLLSVGTPLGLIAAFFFRRALVPRI